MVDRLEELLAQVADEDDEEQADGPAPEAERAVPAAPIPAPESEGRPDLENREESERTEDEADSISEEQGGMRAEIPRAGGENRPEGDGTAPAHEDEPTVPRALRAGDGRAVDGLKRGKPAAAAERTETASTPGAAAERGLEELYRRTAQAGRTAVQGPPAEQAGRTRSAEEPERAAALTVDELDRAVRRDSRRYDGGMSIF